MGIGFHPLIDFALWSKNVNILGTGVHVNSYVGTGSVTTLEETALSYKREVRHWKARRPKIPRRVIPDEPRVAVEVTTPGIWVFSDVGTGFVKTSATVSQAGIGVRAGVNGLKPSTGVQIASTGLFLTGEIGVSHVTIDHTKRKRREEELIIRILAAA